MEDTYNGWTNYSTWRVNLELISDYADNLRSNDQTFDSVDEIAENFSDYTEEALTNFGENETGIALDYARSFVSDVNWHEIAEHYTDELLAEPEEDKEETA